MNIRSNQTIAAVFALPLLIACNSTTMNGSLDAGDTGPDLEVGDVPAEASSVREADLSVECPWVCNDRRCFREHPFFVSQPYVDCRDHDSEGFFWPPVENSSIEAIECGIDEPVGGQDSPYWKHLSPDPARSPLDKPERTTSSILFSVEGAAATGSWVQTMAIMVHPKLEALAVRPLLRAGITESDALDRRVKALYDPFLEGATGQPVRFEVAREIFDAAWACSSYVTCCAYAASPDGDPPAPAYRCEEIDCQGPNGADGQTWSLGDYTATVRFEFGDGGTDCNISIRVKAGCL